MELHSETPSDNSNFIYKLYIISWWLKITLTSQNRWQIIWFYSNGISIESQDVWEFETELFDWLGELFLNLTSRMSGGDQPQ